MRNRLNAFTISETLISMTIACIITAVTYLILGSFYTQMKWYNSTSSNTESFVQATYELSEQLFKATKIVEKETSIQVITMNDTLQISNESPLKLANCLVRYKNASSTEETSKYIKLKFQFEHPYGAEQIDVVVEKFKFQKWQ